MMTFLIRKGTRCIALLLFLFFISSCEEAELPIGNSATPNVIIIFTDDLDFDELNFYDPLAFPTYNKDHQEGREVKHPFNLIRNPSYFMPHIDKLASEAAVMTRFYTPSATCTGSRYSLLTGNYPSENSYLSNKPIDQQDLSWFLDVSPSENNLAKQFNQIGYETSFFGKWHNGVNHQKLKVATKDFSRRRDMRLPESEYKKFVEFIQDSLEFDHADRLLYDNFAEPNIDWISEGIIQFIEGERADPFFMFVALPMPHGQFWDIGQVDPHWTPTGDLSSSPSVYYDQKWAKWRNKLSFKEARKSNGTWIDACVGNIVKSLENTGKLDETIIIFTSDQQTRGKFSAYESCRVPTFIWYPSKIQAQENHQLSGFKDIIPTLDDYIEPSIPNQKHGISIKASLDSKSKNLENEIILETGFSRAIVHDNWKFMINHDPHNPAIYKQDYEVIYPSYYDTHKLFNLENDYCEQKNLYGVEDFKEIQNKLESKLLNRYNDAIQ